jgi:tRNA1(Val) A37 N6-methylase TrmN6
MFAASTSKGPVAEIGCGNGLLQLQLEELLETPVDVLTSTRRPSDKTM